ncbi:MAG: lysophospholipase [Vicinamibacteria bacterium]
MSEAILHTEGGLNTSSGTLFCQVWSPAAPRAALLFVHGLAEHSGRYEHVGRHFAERGYACHAIDYRGHGRSPGPRVHVDSFEPWLDDVKAGLALVRRAHPGLPLFVVGHSQGGLVVLLQGLRDPDDRAGTIVSSPLLGIAPPSRPNGLLRTATKVLMRVAPRLLVPNEVNPAWLSRDPEVGRAYLADPLVSRKVSAGWFRALQEAMARARAGAPRWTSPLLVLASRGDRIVDADATARWVAAAPAAHVTSFFWNDLHHELFNETTQQDVFAAMERWLDACQGQRTERA